MYICMYKTCKFLRKHGPTWLSSTDRESKKKILSHLNFYFFSPVFDLKNKLAVTESVKNPKHGLLVQTQMLSYLIFEKKFRKNNLVNYNLGYYFRYVYHIILLLTEHDLEVTFLINLNEAILQEIMDDVSAEFTRSHTEWWNESQDYWSVVPQKYTGNELTPIFFWYTCLKLTYRMSYYTRRITVP